jgi:hypothetical protein
MFAQIRGNLNRQAKGLELLQQLQAEEFEFLVKRDSGAISALEFSIHELLRQLAVERDELKGVMQGTKVSEYAQMLPEEEGEQIRVLLQVIDQAEQKSARQAEKNTTLSLRLLDQSQELMVYLYDTIQPKSQVVYSAKGNYANSRPQAAIFSGRL